MRNIFPCAVLLVASLLSVSALAGARIDVLKNVVDQEGYQMPSDDCFQNVLEIEQKTGRTLSKREIMWTIKGFLQTQGLPLVKKKRHCFTCGMRVLTPSGYVAISKLKVGDLVYSWDESAKRVVNNKVTQAFISEEEEFGELSESPTGMALEVTAGHQFLLPSGEYKEIGRIGPLQAIAAINMDGDTCEQFLQPRGDYNTKGVGRVHTISVGNSPHNFIVEGLIVHNKPILHL